jgi:addiction module HigA family antidote
MRNEAKHHGDLEPVHPGEILKEEFLEEYGLSQYEVAKRIGVPLPRINAIVLGKRGISADTAMRLARFFENSPEFWLNLQSHYDLEVAASESGDEIDKSVNSNVSDVLEERMRRHAAR